LIIQIILTLLAITTVVYIYKQYKTESEELLMIKLVGYYLLGSFRFNLNNIALPIGFIIYLLFFRVTKNKIAKRATVYLGLFIFICGLLVPRLQEAYFERQRKVMVSCTNIYTIDLNNDFNEIKQKLGVKETVKIEDFDADFDDSGAIKKLEYKLITKDKEGFILYNVTLSSNKYTLKPIRVKEWLQYDRLINEEQFFYALGHLDLKQIKPEEKYPYYTIKCDGDYTNWAVKDWDNFLITNNGYKKLKNEELPASGYVFWIFGNKSNGTNSFVSDGSKVYILTM
jgi:hypothetical protein